MGKTDIVICSSEHVKLSLLDFSADEQKSHSHTPALKEVNVSSTSPPSVNTTPEGVISLSFESVSVTF